MEKSELYNKGEAVRRSMYGDEAFEKTNKETYGSPLMGKFIDVATETVFGGLWARPGIDLKTRALICVVSDVSTAREEELAIHLRFALQVWLTFQSTMDDCRRLYNSSYFPHQNKCFRSLTSHSCASPTG